MGDPESKGGCDVCCPPKMGMGDYDYKYLCMPTLLPWCKKGGVNPPTWFNKDEKLPIMLSLLLGFQHCLAMLVGIATSGGYLIANDACLPWQKDTDMCDKKPWLISCAWITSGLLTIIQVFRVKIKGTPWYLGTGLISVMGTSFTFLPIARSMTIDAVGDAKGTSCALTNNGTTVLYTGACCHAGNCFGAGSIGYGKFLGTCIVGALVEVLLGLMPPKVIKTLCPPIVAGTAVMLIGGGLISAGIKYVGGGVFCAENTESRSTTFGSPQLCAGDNGAVVLSFGSAEYVGLAFGVMCFACLIQIFGSPFLKSTFILWSLAFGCLLAVGGKDVDGDGVKESYYREDYFANIEKTGRYVTFLWAGSGMGLPADADPSSYDPSSSPFPLGFSGIYLPLVIIAYIVSSAETIGDVGMTCIYSKIEDDKDVSARIQGGILADGVNSFLAGLFGSPPNTTFSQNNGLIALTRCASRSAGFSCAFWLILMGVFSSFGAAFASIPICVVGGVVLMMFSAVMVSGIAMVTQDFTRRNQFILMLSLGVGLGVGMEGHIFDWPGPYTFFRRNLAYDYGFWPEKMVCTTPNAPWIDDDGLCHNVGFFGVNNGNCCKVYDELAQAGRKLVLLILKTPYGIGFIIAFVLNLVLPEDKLDEELESEKKSAVAETATA